MWKKGIEKNKALNLLRRSRQINSPKRTTTKKLLFTFRRHEVILHSTKKAEHTCRKHLPYQVGKTTSSFRFKSRLFTAIFCFFFSLKFKPETDWNLGKTSDMIRKTRTQLMSNFDIIRTRGKSYRPTSKIMDFQFSHLSRFSANAISLCKANRNEKFTEIVAR